MKSIQATQEAEEMSGRTRGQAPESTRPPDRRLLDSYRIEATETASVISVTLILSPR